MTVVDTRWRELPTTRPPPPMHGVAIAFYTHTRLGSDPAHLTGQVLDGEDTHTWIYIRSGRHMFSEGWSVLCV